MPDEQTPVFQPDVLIIPGAVAFDKSLQPLDQLLYGVIYWLEHLKDGRCYASNNTLAKVVGSSSSGIANALVRLREGGFIHCEYDDQKHRKGIITLVNMKKTPYSNEEGGVPQMSNRGNNTKTEKYTSETLQAIRKVYLLYIKYMRLEPQDLAGVTDPAERTAILQAAAKGYRLTDKRRDKIAARLDDAGAEKCGRAIRALAQSDFHRGENDRNWKASLEWIMGSYEKVEEWADR